jgi:hypothetical protein
MSFELLNYGITYDSNKATIIKGMAIPFKRSLYYKKKIERIETLLLK